MIVKINIQDNDFASGICDVLQRKVSGLLYIFEDYFWAKLDDIKEKNDPESLRQFVEISTKRDDLREWFMSDDGIPKEEVKNVKQIVKDSVLFLIKNHYDNDTLKYLKDNITISFPKTMKGEWENGEVIYYFPTTYSKNKFLLF